MKRLIVSLLGMALLVYVVACNSTTSTVVPTPTIPSTSTKIPTATETYTPFPTNTSLPSAIPACPPQPDSQATLNSVQEKTAALVLGAKVTWYDNFNCLDLSYGWGDTVKGFYNPTTKVSVSNGILTFSTQKAINNTWDSIGHFASLGDQKGFLVLFRYQENSIINLFFVTGTWQEADYRRWGLSIGNVPSNASWEGWHGTNYLGSNFPSKVLQPNRWYYLLEKLDNNGQVTMKVWEKDNPSKYADFQKVMPSNWIGRQWGFLVQVYDGMVEMDEYQELSFDTP